jgi:GT2 family glycosyltransferase
MSSVLVIGVHYRNQADTELFVRDVLVQESGTHVASVIIADNSADFDSGRTEQGGRDRLRIFRPERNVGYLPGAAAAFQSVTSSTAPPTWTIVSNTDIRIPGSDFLTTLLDRVEVSADLAVVAPRVKLPGSGRDQNPFLKHRPSAWTMYAKGALWREDWTRAVWRSCSNHKAAVTAVLRRTFLRRTFLRRTRGDDLHRLETSRIYAPHGSFLIFHANYFQRGGTLKHLAPLYGEEIFVAETVQRLGMYVQYDPRLVVLHKEHSTTALSPTAARQMGEATRQVTRAYFGRASPVPARQGSNGPLRRG